MDYFGNKVRTDRIVSVNDFSSKNISGIAHAQAERYGKTPLITGY